MAYRKKSSSTRSYKPRSSTRGRGVAKRNAVPRRRTARKTSNRSVSRAPQTIRIVMETMPQAYAARPEGMLVPVTKATSPRKAKF